MGRIFETRKATMFARWNKMSKQFTRIAKDIVMAVKAGGPDPNSNPALRRQIHNARALNMPKDKIEAAIKRAQGKDTANYEELIYEGYAPHGVAVLVVTATDNPTRTVTNVRTVFGKAGGNLGSSGSVAFAFTRMGVFRLDPTTVKDADQLELELIDHGLEEMGEGTGEKGDKQIVIRCALSSFGDMQKALEAHGLVPISAESEFIAHNPMTLPEDQATEVLAMVDKLEQDEDVQQVFHNLG
ncbi:MAG: transcriptional regulator [Deltaproteobacteria bacterium RBG_16_71_12]|nr:MAG: transcriptional regulator [Deltaproteobacteria bacterium RBG_16_71_12]